MGPHIVYNTKTHQAEGPLVEFLSQHIAPAMNTEMNFVFIEMPLVRVLTEMKKGTVAGAAMFGYTEARAHNHLYPRNNFAQMQAVIAVRKDHPLEQIETIEDLYPLKITYVQAAILTPFVKDQNLNWEWTSGNNVWRRNLQKLAAGRAEAVYSPQVANIIYGAIDSGVEKKIRILLLPEPPQKLYTLFSKHPKHKGLLERYDKAMDKINGRLIYKEIMNRHLNSQLHSTSQQPAQALEPPQTQQ
ncbi:hypothetical protein [Maricurvus nonylphenolicus]|uniref:hypothetical protein n=1 Tax=Maricurvus nonylphenolicus TaxID=1008307 RepID=UPI0036F3AB35